MVLYFLPQRSPPAQPVPRITSFTGNTHRHIPEADNPPAMAVARLGHIHKAAGHHTLGVETLPAVRPDKQTAAHKPPAAASAACSHTDRADTAAKRLAGMPLPAP